MARGDKHRLACVLVGLGASAVLASTLAASQGRPPEQRRVATTVDALATYPVFFHLSTVRVRGTLTANRQDVSLADGEATVLLVGRGAAGLSADDSRQEVVGIFVDPGRLTQSDPRLSGIDVERLTRERFDKPWPGVNQLPLLIVQSVEPAAPFPAPSVRALALTPERYIDAQVSVTGRFRGRNLYGDQPDAPGRSRWDFVLQSAESSIWVAGIRPRGPGFNFDVDSRVDTDQWLTVNGIVRRERHLVVLEGASVALAKPPAETPSEPVARVRVTGPPPEVLFSLPSQDETDVSPQTRVRIQFSRDLDPASLKGQVQVGYQMGQSTERGEPQPPPLPFSAAYDPGSRVLELRFPSGLDRFRTVKVQLLDGIKATDGVALAPWTLTFSLGG